MNLPWRTSPTLSKPSEWRALAMARPCGSRTPFFKVIWTRAFMTLRSSQSVNASLHRGGTLHVARPAFGENAQAARDFLIGLFDIAEVAAEAVLVELLAGLGVPEPAIVRADLIG